jgi:hypothetical protein
MDYTKETQERWGKTEAYSEYAEKVSKYSPEKLIEINAGLDGILGEFAVCMKSGLTHDSVEAKALVRKLRDYITENYYTCTDEILAGLGQMYVNDERFKKNIDRHADGTAEFISEAIKGEL